MTHTATKRSIAAALAASLIVTLTSWLSIAPAAAAPAVTTSCPSEAAPGSTIECTIEGEVEGAWDAINVDTDEVVSQGWAQFGATEITLDMTAPTESGTTLRIQLFHVTTDTAVDGIYSIIIGAAPTSISATIPPAGAGELITVSASITSADPVMTGSVDTRINGKIVANSPVINGGINLTLAPRPAGTYAIEFSFVPERPEILAPSTVTDLLVITGVQTEFCVADEPCDIVIGPTTEGVTYELFVDGVSIGSQVGPVGGGILDFSIPLQAVGTISAEVRSGASTLTSRNVAISPFPLPSVTVDAPSTTLTNTPVVITLSGSDVAGQWQVAQVSGSVLGSVTAGLGATTTSLSFTSPTAPGMLNLQLFFTPGPPAVPQPVGSTFSISVTSPPSPDPAPGPAPGPAPEPAPEPEPMPAPTPVPLPDSPVDISGGTLNDRIIAVGPRTRTIYRATPRGPRQTHSARRGLEAAAVSLVIPRNASAATIARGERQARMIAQRLGVPQAQPAQARKWRGDARIVVYYYQLGSNS